MEWTTVAASRQAICTPIVDHEADRSTESGEITISCYENEVPPFVETEMDQLYENLYSSLAQFRIYGAARNASTYVVRKDGKAITIFLFRREKGKVEVINKVIKIDEEDVRRFVNTIFAAFRSVTVISFRAIQTDIQRLPFPYQRFNYLEDIVLTLPGTTEEYLASLGKSTRKTIKRYMSRLKQSFPSFCYEVYEKEEVAEQQIRGVIKMKMARMADKNKVWRIKEEEIERKISLVSVCGLVGVVTIDGRVCAGAISYRIGANYFMAINTYDPEYDDYRLGTLCCYLTICDYIARGGKECHFLWGQDEYKYSLLGVQRDLDYLAVYRSRAHLLLNGDMVLKTACRGYVRQAKLWLRDAKRQDSLISRLAIKSLNLVRRLKRFGPGVLVGRKEDFLGQSREK